MLKELGANHLGGDDFGFLVWAPLSGQMELRILSPSEEKARMEKRDDGFFEAVVGGLGTGSRYVYVIDGEKERPDPASRFQPDGVLSPSALIRHDDFRWTDHEWKGLPLEDYIIYELHVGTFTPEGTFDAAASRVPYLKDLGVTAVQLMPVAQFPGGRNWGYDGTYPFAVQQSYGGPDGLKRLVDACHTNGLAVILDVVYNHLGPEGNYLADFGPYFTDRYRTPWGQAINFDGPYSDGVRRFFIENAIYWLETYHMDALRIDAVHGIFDFSAKHFLMELKETVQSRLADKMAYLISESDLNDVRLIDPPEKGGYGLDAQWNDDFHHCLHTLLTGEKSGYYIDFGDLEHMAKAVGEGFVYSGQYSEFRKRRHGSSTKERPPGQFVVFSQNHDQVGNRAEGDRLSAGLSTEKLKLAACLVILSPNIPLLFMGEEYAETAPFRYFISHSDPALVEAVRKGRRKEFSHFGCQDIPDPQDEAAFLDSKINPELREGGRHRDIYEFYRTVIGLRKKLAPLLKTESKETVVTVFEEESALLVRLPRLFYAASFSGEPVELKVPFEGPWQRVFESYGAGSADSPSVNIHGVVRLGPYGFSLYRMDA